MSNYLPHFWLRRFSFVNSLQIRTRQAHDAPTHPPPSPLPQHIGLPPQRCNTHISLAMPTVEEMKETLKVCREFLACMRPINRYVEHFSRLLKLDYEFERVRLAPSSMAGPGMLS